jgi:hypothetical protein
MNLNVDEILQMVQDFRSQLSVWGVNSEGLLVIGFVAAVLFVFSLREVVTWFFRVNQVRDEVRELRSQLILMQETLDEMKDRTLGKPEPVQPMKPEELVKAAEVLREVPKFRLDH